MQSTDISTSATEPIQVAFSAGELSHIARFTVSTDPDIADRERERGVPDPRGLYVFGTASARMMAISRVEFSLSTTVTALLLIFRTSLLSCFPPESAVTR